MTNQRPEDAINDRSLTMTMNSAFRHGGLVLLLTILGGTAQADSLETDTQGWAALAIAGPIRDDRRLLLWYDGHARYGDDISDLGVTISRPALGWRATPKLDLWVGYAWVISRSSTGPDTTDRRFWQQATYPMGELFGGRLSGRSRLERRSFNLTGDTGWRLRQFVRWERPLPQEGLSLVAWDELFVGLNDAGRSQFSGFDQNRLFVGLAWRFADKARAELGYMNNLINRSGSENRLNNVLSATLFLNL